MMKDQQLKTLNTRHILLVYNLIQKLAADCIFYIPFSSYVINMFFFIDVIDVFLTSHLCDTDIFPQKKIY